MIITIFIYIFRLLQFTWSGSKKYKQASLILCSERSKSIFLEMNLEWKNIIAYFLFIFVRYVWLYSVSIILRNYQLRGRKLSFNSTLLIYVYGSVFYTYLLSNWKSWNLEKVFVIIDKQSICINAHNMEIDFWWKSVVNRYHK